MVWFFGYLNEMGGAERRGRANERWIDTRGEDEAAWGLVEGQWQENKREFC